MEQFIGLISKVSIVLVFIFTSVIIGENFTSKRKDLKQEESANNRFLEKSFHQLIQGFVFSFLIIIEMLTSFSGPNGVRYDARVVLLNLSTTYGALSGAITAFTAVLIRISSRTNYLIAISSIALVYLLELAFIYYERKKGVKNYYRYIFLLSLLTNIINGIYITIVSGSEWRSSIVPAITYVVAYPLFTVVAYSVMCYIRSRDELLWELSNRDKILQATNEELSRMNDSLKENEFRLRTMFSNSGEAILLIEDFKISEVNRKGIELLGYKKKENLVGKELPELIIEIKFVGENEKRTIEEVCERVKAGENINAEVIMKTKHGSEIPLEVFMVDIEVPGVEYIYMSARDIRERKKIEFEMLYKARHDALTTVANRQFFEETLSYLVTEPKNYPIAYMMADINGLKLVNDIFGHAEGDMLIVKISETLTRGCRNGDIVARIGGDEFAILFTKVNERIIRSVMERVKKALKNERVETVEPSLSMGYAIKESIDDEISVEDMAKLADEMMYKNKLEDRKANVRIFLDNLINRLYEKSPEDRDSVIMLTTYLERIKNIPSFELVTKREVGKLIRYVNIGKLITDRSQWEISVEDIDEISFHKKLLEASETIISKIAHAEDGIMKRDEILLLNERWDGMGDKGLAGNDIPLTIRTFKILYDLSFVLNKKELFFMQNEEEVLDVLSKYAGTKYDPNLFGEIRKALIDTF